MLVASIILFNSLAGDIISRGRSFTVVHQVCFVGVILVGFIVVALGFHLFVDL